MIGNNIIVSPYQTNWITKDVYSRVKNNLPASPVKNVPMFQVSDISYENPIFTDNPTRAFPVVIAVGIGGGIAGAINAWEPNGFCGAGIIIGMASSGALSKYLAGSCASCHRSGSSYYGGESEYNHF